MKKFGEKLQALRTRRHLTLKELASALGYRTHSYISEIEAGKKQPTVEFTIAVARLFAVSTDELLKDELKLESTDVLMKRRKRLKRTKAKKIEARHGTTP